MAEKGSGDRSSKTAIVSVWGNSLLNKLAAIARRRVKRQADKLRRRDEIE